MAETERLMSITDLAEMLGVPVDTLYGWRHRGEGPAGYRIGRHVRYRRSAVETWLAERADVRPRVAASGMSMFSAKLRAERLR